jgi:hypothetical protein
MVTNPDTEEHHSGEVEGTVILLPQNHTELEGAELIIREALKNLEADTAA